VAESTEADDGDLPARTGAPVPQRSVRRDAGTEQRCRGSGIEAVGDREDESASTTTWVE